MKQQLEILVRFMLSLSSILSLNYFSSTSRHFSFKTTTTTTTTTKPILMIIMFVITCLCRPRSVSSFISTSSSSFVPRRTTSPRVSPRVQIIATKRYLSQTTNHNDATTSKNQTSSSSSSSSSSQPIMIETMQQQMNNDNKKNSTYFYQGMSKDKSNKAKNDKTTKHKRQRPSPPPLPDPSEFPAWVEKDFFHFEILHESSKSQARVGRIHTPHGIIDTPGFVAVATNGALKAVDFRDANDAGQQLIFANTYHLMLHPGADRIGDAGGIHKFTNRPNGPFITDSGGFQVFSLAYEGEKEKKLASEASQEGGGVELKQRANTRHTKRKKDTSHTSGENPVKVTEEGVRFRSYRDGSKFLLTPESTVQAQKQIGADIIIPLDELPPYHIDRSELIESVNRSHRWEARSLKEHLKDVKEQAMFAVIHGGVDVELRTQSVEYLTSLPFDGYAIGGSLGNGREELKELLAWMMPLFDETPERKSKPRHLLGIADEESIRNAVARGLDTLDSCYPTRIGRHGTLMTSEGTIRIVAGKHSKSYGVPIDPNCTCKTCTHYDRAYLWHLFKANEPLALSLATLHNIHYMNNLMAQLRQDILDNKI